MHKERVNQSTVGLCDSPNLQSSSALYMTCFVESGTCLAIYMLKYTPEGAAKLCGAVLKESWEYCHTPQEEHVKQN